MGEDALRLISGIASAGAFWIIMLSPWVIGAASLIAGVAGVVSLHRARNRGVRKGSGRWAGR